MRWFATHGFYLGPKDGITHRVLGPWHDEHTTAPHTGTVIFANETAWPAFHCSHVHCEGRTLLNVMAIWGGADQFCASPWQGASWIT